MMMILEAFRGVIPAVRGFVRRFREDYQLARSSSAQIARDQPQWRATGARPPLQWNGPLPPPSSNGDGWTYWCGLGDGPRRQTDPWASPYERALQRRGGKWCA